ncbi:hypothetical protein KM043_001853 [Ampulex compressa]|nr:hypothetical protein KM043_001853 [Ampulex compressa]
MENCGREGGAMSGSGRWRAGGLAAKGIATQVRREKVGVVGRPREYFLRANRYADNGRALACSAHENGPRARPRSRPWRDAVAQREEEHASVGVDTAGSSQGQREPGKPPGNFRNSVNGVSTWHLERGASHCIDSPLRSDGAGRSGRYASRYTEDVNRSAPSCVPECVLPGWGRAVGRPRGGSSAARANQGEGNGFFSPLDEPPGDWLAAPLFLWDMPADTSRIAVCETEKSPTRIPTSESLFDSSYPPVGKCFRSA